MLSEFRAAERITAHEWLALLAILGTPLLLLVLGVWLVLRALGR